MPVNIPGGKAYIKHYRYDVRDKRNALILRPNGVYRSDPHLKASAKGGLTEAVIVMEDGRISSGLAFCSLSENFSRRAGRELAISRALVRFEK